MTSIREAAVRLARQGIRVLPVGKNKVPRLAHGVLDASADPLVVDLWFSGRYADDNVAIATGPDSRLFVVDVDDMEIYQPLLDEFPGIENTRITSSGRMGGGRHLWFRWPEGYDIRSRTWRPGVDIKGRGGYCVAPPSIHQTGVAYAVVNAIPPQEAPQALLEALQDRRQERADDGNWRSASGIPQVLEAGGRRNALIVVAGYLRMGGLSVDEMMPTLMEVNERRAGGGGPLPEVEVEALARSAERDFLARPSPQIAAPAAEEETDDPYRLVPRSVRADRPPMTWLVEHYIPDRGVGQVFGPTYVGKSFVAIDLALRVATGQTHWHGEPIRRHGDVIYALMEGVFDFQQRVDVWLAAHPGTTDDRLWTVEGAPMDLIDPASCESLVAAVADAGVAPALVVVDTQSLACSADENSNTEMNVMFRHLKHMSDVWEAPVMTVHHTGHDESRSRGASAQRAALDVEIRVQDGTVTMTKVKAWGASRPMPFSLASVDGHQSVWAKPGIEMHGEPGDDAQPWDVVH